MTKSMRRWKIDEGDEIPYKHANAVPEHDTAKKQVLARSPVVLFDSKGNEIELRRPIGFTARDRHGEE